MSVIKKIEFCIFFKNTPEKPLFSCFLFHFFLLKEKIKVLCNVINKKNRLTIPINYIYFPMYTILVTLFSDEICILSSRDFLWINE